ncbi:MAG TPA: hypothetical protein VGT98_05040, partial [Candidatus Elarobacter sp.]|nr:hypothetical protein [Candidatus Elarobacter sp.]
MNLDNVRRHRDMQRSWMTIRARNAAHRTWLAAVLGAGVLMGSGCAHSTSALEGEMRPIDGGRATPPAAPPFVETDEATTAQLEHVRAQGDAFAKELEWVRREESAASGDLAAGPYVITYLVTPVDDYYDLEAATASLPAHHDVVERGAAHIGVVVRDAADGRLVQGLAIRAMLVPDGERGGTSATLRFGWHPILNRYGENVVLPSKPFTLRLVIAPPTYARHDSVNGRRFADSVIAEFANVTVPRDSLAGAARRFASGEPRSATELARGEGDAVRRSVDVMLARTTTRGTQRVGDYEVSVTTSRAKPQWAMRRGALQYDALSADDTSNAHLEVVVREAATGRVMSGLDVHATVLDARGR